MEDWIDYYSVLQVHQDAEPDIIQSAYKRLCLKYHPDVNKSPDALCQMQRINEAYAVLSDPARRQRYHSHWQKRQSQGTREPSGASAPPPPPPPAPDPSVEGTPAARAVVQAYFTHLTTGRFKEAYDLLCVSDRKHISFDSFLEWQASVSSLYSIGCFSLKLFKRHEDFVPTGSRRSLTAEEYTISVTEKNLSTGQVAEYAFTKHAVQDRDGWRLHLGYTDLEPILKQFSFSAASEEDSHIAGHWEHYRRTHDMTMGLLNRDGFLENAAPEAYRYKRYRRPCTVCVFQLHFPAGDVTEEQQGKIERFVAYILRKHLRLPDVASYLGDSRFAVLLCETGRHACAAAVRRIVMCIKRDVCACFEAQAEVFAGYCEYNGDELSEILRICVGTLEGERGLPSRFSRGFVWSRN